MDKNGLIGNENRLPWFLPEELAFFKATTLNKTILMGRKTFANLKVKPLKQRKTIVITNDKQYAFDDPDVSVSHDLAALVKRYANNSQADLYVCGGAKIYQATFDQADKLIVSIVDGEYQGDTYFPINDFAGFQEVHRQKHETFLQLIYERKKNNE